MGQCGRPRNPVLEPHPELIYAQLVKKKRGRLYSLNERIRWGQRDGPPWNRRSVPV
jgi:hypothetical protein